jgi:hypothetical protein
MIETFIGVLIVLVLIFIAAWLAKWIIDTFFAGSPVAMPAYVIVGLFLLIILILAMAYILGGADVKLPTLRR